VESDDIVLKPLGYTTHKVSSAANRQTQTRTVRSWVLIKPWSRKESSDRFVWASSHKGLPRSWGRFLFIGAPPIFISWSEALL